ncbi:MAG: TonB-dependent receptor [Pseudomonadota bacterium]
MSAKLKTGLLLSALVLPLAAPLWAQEPEASAAPPASEPVPTTAAETPPAPAESAAVPVAELPPPAPAETEDEGLEEIVVTAQKRGDESIKDVPLSISVVNEKMIADMAITNVREAMLFVPNVKVEEAGYFMIPRIRGFTTNNNNKAFEPPAGLAIDGIPYGRVEYFNSGLFDISRVEALRGPQGTTFGKNTTAGLLHIITRDPTPEFKGYVDAQAGEFDRRRIEFGVGGALIPDVLNVRVAGMSDSQRGYIFNTTKAISARADEFAQGRDNQGFRAKLLFPNLLESSLKLTYEQAQLGSLGSGIELINITESMKVTLRKYDPNVDFVGGNGINSLDFPDRRTTEIRTFNGEWTRDFFDWTLALLGGRSEMNTEFELDTDFSPANALNGTGADFAPTTTFEARLLSPSLPGLFGLNDILGFNFGDSDILIGGFMQNTAIENGFFDFEIPVGPFLELTAAAEGSGNTDDDPPGLPEILGLPPTDPLFNMAEVIETVRQDFEQFSKTKALFSQVQWRFFPDFTLQLGGRYSQEEKNARWDSHYTTDTGVVLKAAGIDEFEAARAREDKFFQYKGSLNWQPTEGLSLFAHAARSFKSGGYNAFAFREVEDQLGFGPEFTKEYGFDIKGTLFERRLALNLSAYYMEVRDFQVLTREPQTTGVDPATGDVTLQTIGLGITKVINAPKARAQGIEGDVTWKAANWLKLFGTFGLNDTQYLDHKKNDCPPDRDSSSMPFCDATGKPFAFAPKYNSTISVFVTPTFELAGIRPDLIVSAEYASEQFTDIDLDERKVQEAFWRYRASVGFGNPKQGWSFKIIGENLTDEITYIRQGDLSPKQFVGIVEPPRRFYGQLRWSF